MNLMAVGGHSIDLDLLPEAPLVLDVGCRYFNFSSELLNLRPNARVICLDPALDIVEVPDDSRITFFRKALVETDQSSVWLTWEGDGSRASLEPEPGVLCGLENLGGAVAVPTISFRKILSDFGCHFDLIKFDCEGSEFAILENWPGPVATQISVEFHDTWGSGLHDDSYFENLFNRPLQDYHVIQHEATPAGNYGYWHADTLLVLKAAKYLEDRYDNHCNHDH